ncbi:MAG TPA: TfoX/Sxy family protein [Burkholderiaceae bacterium]|nr:TfoX/Sxy family protein [Burkholderiaceae bacterium]HQR71611.1 TfoX/Sxy family protein [Burkholderiaceae bacterium]
MNEFVDHVLELMEPWAPVRARRMFGGLGLYREARMFALVFDDTLYLKVAPDTRDRFAAAGCTPFFYRSGGRNIEMSYWRAPDACIDDPAAMSTWCALAWEAAWRSPPSVRKATRKVAAREGPQSSRAAQSPAPKSGSRRRPRR